MAIFHNNDVSSLSKRIDLWLHLAGKKAAKHIKRAPRQKQSIKSLRLPDIPAEIWGIVIYHACLLYYDPLDTSNELSFLDESPLRLSTYRDSMKLKTTIALVSKQWNAFVRIPLYEFVWISRAGQAKALARTLLMEYVQGNRSSGEYIRRLHIETPILARCSPVDLRTILDHAPHLFIYSDHHSVQRSCFFDESDPRYSPEEILKLVAHPKMRRLSWTSYGDVPFHLRMSPLLKNLATQLEYLELSSCFPHIRTVFAGSSGQVGNFNTQMDVHLPSLRALKVSLDNNTFSVLASWIMPHLTNLSVLSSDFSYTGPGFASFFEAHGAKIRQLELGHCSTIVEEHYLTAPSAHLQNQPPKSLAEWCPNLREFICSAEAEWHWQAPDWIAPHILLPSHPTLELIGIRDLDARLCNDPGEAYFPLYTQMCDLLQADLFPSLRFIRDLSEHSHELRIVKPSPKVMQFWMRLLERCQERGIWYEDYMGVNITMHSLLRANLPNNNANRWHF
ncbi:unnamed protein product [Somion occarium]|uniref:F-box domain-containing protein n=1 Tax=Somion occarium TaxID=3059160 RepID=A0ABP1DU48_9APHY